MTENETKVDTTAGESIASSAETGESTSQDSNASSTESSGTEANTAGSEVGVDQSPKTDDVSAPGASDSTAPSSSASDAETASTEEKKPQPTFPQVQADAKKLIADCQALTVDVIALVKENAGLK